MAVLSDYTSGTISLAQGSVTVTGTGTLFEVTRFREGDTLQIQNLTAVIASVNSNTSLTLTAPWTGTSLNDAPYRARYLPDGARVTAQATTLIELLGNGVLSNLAELGVEDGKTPVGNAAGRYELKSVFLPSIRNVLDYGATADGVADTAPSIQLALDAKGTIYFPAGRYRVVGHALRIYSDTTLILDPEAVILNDINIQNKDIGAALFVNGPLGGNQTVGGYDAEKNIRILNGVLDCSPRAAKGWQATQIAWSHLMNVDIFNVKFLAHSGNTHAIEFNSTKCGRIKDCHFDGYIANGAGLGSREYINIDQSYQNGFPIYGPWDGTPCSDIEVSGCTFKNGDVAVGSHNNSLTALNHINIRIFNNTIINMTSFGFRSHEE